MGTLIPYEAAGCISVEGITLRQKNLETLGFHFSSYRLSNYYKVDSVHCFCSVVLSHTLGE